MTQGERFVSSEVLPAEGVGHTRDTNDFNPDRLLERVDADQVITAEGYSPDRLLERLDGSTETESLDSSVGELPSSTDVIADVTPRETVGKVYTDDSGVIYRVNDDLLPNNRYEIHGYSYSTDDQGRIVSAEGQLHLKTHGTKLAIKDGMETIGKGSQRKTDDRGHLIADMFGGGNGLENIVAMDHELNGKGYLKLEQSLKAALEHGDEVYLKVEPQYSDDIRRPSSFVVTTTINGETTETVFRNEGAKYNA